MCMNVRNIGNRNLLPSRIKILLKDINSTVDANHPQTIDVVFRSFLFFPPDDDDDEADVSSGSPPSFDASSNVLPRFDDPPFEVLWCALVVVVFVVIVIASTNDWKLIIFVLSHATDDDDFQRRRRRRRRRRTQNERKTRLVSLWRHVNNKNDFPTTTTNTPRASFFCRLSLSSVVLKVVVLS